MQSVVYQILLVWVKSLNAFSCAIIEIALSNCLLKAKEIPRVYFLKRYL